MKILYLLLDPTQAADHRHGGYATHVREVVQALEAAGHQVELLDSRPPELGAGRSGRSGSHRGIAPGLIGIAPVPKALRPAGRDLLYLLHNLRASRLVEARLARGGIDLVYERFHHLQGAGMRAARRRQLPSILEFNAGVNEAAAFHGVGLGLLARWIETSTLRAADRIITVSGVLRRQVIALGLPADHVVAMHNGVDTQRFHPGIDGARARHRFGLADDDVVVGFVGSFAPWHGVELLIDAALSLVPETPQLRFLLVGGRPDEPRFIAARRRVEAAGSLGRIVFAGEVPFAEVPEAMAAMDIATIPWATDYGSPMKVAEYMAMGRALIAPDLEVLREVLADGRNALLVPRGDASALAGAIRRLAATPPLRRALGSAARRDAVEHHDWRHHARTIEELAEGIRRSRAARPERPASHV
jgi:glycosyltransferase involved in cell wall biosynthesis